LIDSRLARFDQFWIRVRAEDHVPNWEHRGIVGVPVIRSDRMVNAMEFRCDEDSVNEGRDTEGDVGVSQRSKENCRDELPNDESGRHTNNHERRPDDQPTSQEVEDVMPRTLERV